MAKRKYPPVPSVWVMNNKLQACEIPLIMFKDDILRKRNEWKEITKAEALQILGVEAVTAYGQTPEPAKAETNAKVPPPVVDEVLKGADVGKKPLEPARQRTVSSRSRSKRKK